MSVSCKKIPASTAIVAIDTLMAAQAYEPGALIDQNKKWFPNRETAFCLAKALCVTIWRDVATITVR